MTSPPSLSTLRLELRTLALLLGSGVTLAKALEVVEESAGEEGFRQALRQVRRGVEAGSALSQEMSRHPAVFPATLIALARAGEVRGALPDAVRKAADCAEREHETRGRDCADNPAARRLLEVSLWAWQWGTLLEAGVPLLPSLEVLAETTEGQELREATVALHSGVCDDAPLAITMDHYPGVFPLVLRQVVAVGETTGELGRLCREVGDHLERLSREKATGAVTHAPPAVSEESGAIDDEFRGETAGEASQEVTRLLRAAREADATDLHLQPTEDGVRIRLRVNGLLRPAPVPPPALTRIYPAVVAHFKRMAGLDAAPQRLPQRGRLSFRGDNAEVVGRVSVFPTTCGEWVHVHFLPHSAESRPLAELGWEDEQLSQTRALLQSPFGLLVISGPNGSGRTTTLTAMLNELDPTAYSLVSVEESPERELPGVQQAVVERETGAQPAAVLRALARQDPDVVVVDELRDADALSAAIELSVAGRLVLIGMTAPTAAHAAARLARLAREPLLLTEPLIAVIGQRLVPKVCPQCAEATTLTPAQAARLDLPASAVAAATVRCGRGCDACGDAGVRGRTAVFEILSVASPAMQKLVHERADEKRLAALARGEGQLGLRDVLAMKILRGRVSPDEALRILDMLEGD